MVKFILLTQIKFGNSKKFSYLCNAKGNSATQQKQTKNEEI